MGSRVAPSLAIVFMGAVEGLFLSSPRAQPTVYMRYIDDVFGVWSHGADKLDDYVNFINGIHPAIQFTVERSDAGDGKLAFLDTLITVQSDGTYSTELYYKPMAAPIILPYDSAHPARVKKAVLSGQLQRASRLGSHSEAIDRGIAKVKALFRANGYPDRLIRTTARRVLAMPRQPRQSPRSRQKENTFITLPFISDHLCKKVEGAIRSSGLDLQVAWKNENSLKRAFVRSALDPPPCPGGGRKCLTCLSGLGGRCHITNVVYEISCQLCEQENRRSIYIGETKRSVRQRFNEHLRDARHKADDTPLGDHMAACHQNSSVDEHTFKISILRRCEDGPNRKVAESMFIRDRNPDMNTQTTSWPLL